jgi:hypothetical protein
VAHMHARHVPGPLYVGWASGQLYFFLSSSLFNRSMGKHVLEPAKTGSTIRSCHPSTRFNK